MNWLVDPLDSSAAAVVSPLWRYAATSRSRVVSVRASTRCWVSAILFDEFGLPGLGRLERVAGVDVSAVRGLQSRLETFRGTGVLVGFGGGGVREEHRHDRGRTAISHHRRLRLSVTIW
jgi:hypothetical protein